MLCLADIAELEPLMVESNRLRKAFFCVKHDYIPAKDKKFLGQTQTKYIRKNWSSFMLINCSHHYWRELGQNGAEERAGLGLHQFSILEDKRIGELPKGWNYLVGEENQESKNDVKMVHFTNGGCWFDEYKDCEFSLEWKNEFNELLGARQ